MNNEHNPKPHNIMISLVNYTTLSHLLGVFNPSTYYGIFSIVFKEDRGDQVQVQKRRKREIEKDGRGSDAGAERPGRGEDAVVPLHGDRHRRHGLLHRRLRPLLHLPRHQAHRPRLLLRPGLAVPGQSPPRVSSAVNGVAFVGTLSGQLFFGWLGDKLGRKSVYGMTLLLMILCSAASGLSFGRSPSTVMSTLCFFRFWLGFGIGGDYPLSATIMSEYANKRTRGAFIAAVFAMQGFGILAGGCRP
uniref:H(+)/Pi cotransporter n=1 Tax=Ananas comosus var. bracteatus TaxID=296719 RepID=A0A6V7PWV9_ANACO|nr:unnamed protein product [Ananas comosus var. bracteatus]